MKSPVMLGARTSPSQPPGPPRPGTHSSSVQGSVLFTRTWSSEPTWRSLPWMVILVPPALGPMVGSREWTRGSCGETGGWSGPRPARDEPGGRGGGRQAAFPYHVGEALPRPSLLGSVHRHHV